MWSAILSDANEIRKTDWAWGRAAGAGEGGKVPLTSQRSQTHLLGPVYSQLPEPPVPRKSRAHILPGSPPQTLPRRQAAASCPGKDSASLTPCPPQGLPGFPPSPGARGTRRDGGGQVGVLLESQLPLLSTWDRTLPSAPRQICSWSSPSPSHHLVPDGTGNLHTRSKP